MKLNRKSNYYIYLPTNNKKHLKSTKVEFANLTAQSRKMRICNKQLTYRVLRDLLHAIGTVITA